MISFRRWIVLDEQYAKELIYVEMAKAYPGYNRVFSSNELLHDLVHVILGLGFSDEEEILADVATEALDPTSDICLNNRIKFYLAVRSVAKDEKKACPSIEKCKEIFERLSQWPQILILYDSIAGTDLLG